MYGPSPPSSSSSSTGISRSSEKPITAGKESSLSSSSIGSSLFSSSSFKKLDVLFPKFDSDLSVPTNHGGRSTFFAILLIVVLSMAEIISYRNENSSSSNNNNNYNSNNLLEHNTHLTVHRRLDKFLRIDLNITFPSVPSCDSIVAEIIDISGDSFLIDSTTTTTFKRMELSGSGGCNLAGYLVVNRVGGIIHLHADMGDDFDWTLQENSTHLIPKMMEAAKQFDASHIIHELSFGPKEDVISTTKSSERQGSNINIERRIGTDEETGLFSYFCQLVPTTYVERDTTMGSLSSSLLDGINTRKIGTESSTTKTKRKRKDSSTDAIQYYFTEKFQPLSQAEIIGYIDNDDDDVSISVGGKELDSSIDAMGNNGDITNANFEGSNTEGRRRQQQQELKVENTKEEAKEEEGRSTTATKKQKNHHAHEYIQEIIIPGVFLQYELYPFTMEVSKKSVPLLHLLIRLVATIGGVFTVVGVLLNKK